MRKKIITITFLFLTTLALVACKKKSTTKTNDKTKVTTATPTTTEHVHEFGEWKEKVRATCSEDGLKTRSCACGLVQFEVIPKADHTLVNDKCTVCGFEHLTDGFNIYYSELDEMYHIDDYTGESTTVRIPRYYDDGENGEHKIFIDKIVEDDEIESKIKDVNIKKIIIGDGYQTIDENMFLGLNNLEEVVIEGSVMKIGSKAFYNCPNLSKITFNEDLEQIGFYAFGSCNFTEIKLPYDLKVLGIGAFSDNVNLTTVTYYNSSKITEINENAFNNTALTSIKLNYGLTTFGYQANMPNLTTFIIDPRNTKFEFEDGCLVDLEAKRLIKAIGKPEIPSTVTILGQYSLANLDYSDVDFVVPSNIQYISFNAFSGSTFKSFTISNGTKVLDECALSGIDLIDYETIEIVLPSSIQYILFHAFKGLKCKKLTIPESVTYLGYAVFEDCEIEEIVVYQSTLDSPNCDDFWDYGIDLDYTTVTIIYD